MAHEKRLVALLGILAALGPFSIDMYLPSFSAIAKDLGVSIAEVGFTITSYFIGISAGQIIYGPLIDRFGRRRPLLTGLILYCLAVIACSLAPSLVHLAVSRFVMALGACAGIVASRAVVRDSFPPRETARVFSLLMLVMGVAPIIAPSLGGAVTSLFGWRMIFILLSFFSAGLFVMILVFLPESRKPDATVSLRPKAVAVDYLRVLATPQFLFYGLAGGFAYGGLFAYITGSPLVFMELLGLSRTHYGWFFGFNAAGLMLGSHVSGLLVKKHSSETILLFTTCLQAGFSLLMVLGTALHILPLQAAFALPVVYLFCLGIINPNATALSMAPFSKLAGSASALLGSLQMLVSAVSSAAVSYLADGTSLPMLTVIGCFSLAGFGLVLGARRFSRPGLGEATL